MGLRPGRGLGPECQKETNDRSILESKNAGISLVSDIAMMRLETAAGVAGRAGVEA
jgi:hypothetical protein